MRRTLEWEDIAVGNVERHLGDVVEDGMSSEEVYEECYTLAFDALANAGLDHAEARRIAAKIAERYSS